MTEHTHQIEFVEGQVINVSVKRHLKRFDKTITIKKEVSRSAKEGVSVSYTATVKNSKLDWRVTFYRTGMVHMITHWETVKGGLYQKDFHGRVVEIKRAPTDAKSFQDAYHAGKVWADLDKAVENHLTFEDCVKLRDALEVVKEFTGLDARQNFLKGCLSGMINAHAAKFVAVLRNGGSLISVYAHNRSDAKKMIVTDLKRTGREHIYEQWKRHGSLIELR